MTPVLVVTLVVAAYALYVGFKLICIDFLSDDEKKSVSVEERKKKLMRRARQLKSVLLVLFVVVFVSNLEK
jgi:hypothetical protein